MGRLHTHLRRTFLAGIFAAVPLAATVMLIFYIDAHVRDLFRLNIPLLGVVVALVGIYLLGLIVTSLIGRWLLGLLDRLLGRLPILRELYRAWKQVSLTSGDSGIFNRVVLVPDETGQMQTLGFTSGQPIAGDPDTCCVFVPAAPNPTSGRLYFIRRDHCRTLDLSTEEAFKLILSSGNYQPEGLCGDPAPAPDQPALTGPSISKTTPAS